MLAHQRHRRLHAMRFQQLDEIAVVVVPTIPAILLFREAPQRSARDSFGHHGSSISLPDRMRHAPTARPYYFNRDLSFMPRAFAQLLGIREIEQTGGVRADQLANVAIAHLQIEQDFQHRAIAVNRPRRTHQTEIGA